MLNEYDCVRLKDALDVCAVGSGNRIVLESGTRGCVVMVHAGDHPAYEVEFFDRDKRTLAVETVSDSQVELDK